MIHQNSQHLNDWKQEMERRVEPKAECMKKNGDMHPVKETRALKSRQQVGESHPEETSTPQAASQESNAGQCLGAKSTFTEVKPVNHGLPP